jgi:hypothetical protein
MRKFILILTIFIFLSCNHRFPSRDYASLDKFTGGFNDFSLHLDSNGSLKLTLSTSILENENDSGSTWSSRTKIVLGRWELKNSKIEFSFKKSKAEIDSTFINTDWEYLKLKSTLIFSNNLDTAYVYGVPCILKK